MGIDKSRFFGSSHEEFVCPICLDVVDDPLETPCEHLFCKSCLEIQPSKSCPSCRQPFQEYKAMDRNLKSVYETLRMRCKASDCNVRLTVSNYKDHDKSCNKATYKCSTCSSCKPLEDVKSSSCQKCFQDLMKTYEELLNAQDQIIKENRDLRKKIKNLKACPATASEMVAPTPPSRTATAVKSAATKVAQPRAPPLARPSALVTMPIASPLIMPPPSSGACRKIIFSGELHYVCTTCAISSVAVFCQYCFHSGDHYGHSSSSVTNNGYNRYCNCGDPAVLNSNTICSIHKPFLTWI